MYRIACVSIFGIALAVVVALGVPGKANAFVNDNGANSGMILTADLGISIGEGGGVGIDVNRDRGDRDREYERQRAYDQGRKDDQDRRYDNQRRDYNREKREGTYDEN